MGPDWIAQGFIQSDLAKLPRMEDAMISVRFFSSNSGTRPSFQDCELCEGPGHPPAREGYGET